MSFRADFYFDFAEFKRHGKDPIGMTFDEDYEGWEFAKEGRPRNERTGYLPVEDMEIEAKCVCS